MHCKDSNLHYAENGLLEAELHIARYLHHPYVL
jgi:hypothetical protein